MAVLEQRDAVVVEMAPPAHDPTSVSPSTSSPASAAAAVMAGGGANGHSPNKSAPPRLWASMLAPGAAAQRGASFAADGHAEQGSTWTHDYDAYSWMATTFILRDRALGNFAWPWALCVGVAAVWVALKESFQLDGLVDFSEFERIYALIFGALGFMLVFRLSRAAVRFWDCRTAWGRAPLFAHSVLVCVPAHTRRVCDCRTAWVRASSVHGHTGTPRASTTLCVC